VSEGREERLVALEIVAAEQERTIAELSAEIAEQWKVIEKLRRQLGLLSERFLALEERSGPDVPVTKPPHW
jgi:SlyX protein